jgi:hypothetical protein
MRNITSRAFAGLSLTVAMTAMAALSAGSALAQGTRGQQVQARVISANPVSDGNGGYNVTYEYNGRQYSTRTSEFPGATLPVEVSAYGVATMPVAPQSGLEQMETETSDGRPAWEQAVPEPGVVVSTARRPPAPVYYAAPAYVAPAYVAPLYAPPVYVQPGYGYGYAPYSAYPPVGVSLNLGYSRGWGGGHRGWR